MAPEDDKFKGLPKLDQEDLDEYLDQQDLKAARVLRIPPITLFQMVEQKELLPLIEKQVLDAYAKAAGELPGWEPEDEARDEILSSAIAYEDRRNDGGYIIEIPLEDEHGLKHAYVAVSTATLKRPS